MSLNDKSVAGFLLQTVKKYIDKHISVLTTSLNNKNKTKRFKVLKGATSVVTGTPFITNESLISFDRIIGNPATSIANIGVDGDYFVESGTIHFKEFNKDIVISCGVNYGVHDIAHADVLGQGTTENDISVMKRELDMLSGSGIGYNGIYYIQDAGSKEAGKIYLDKTQEGIWKCLKTTTSINNTSDFERIDNTTLDDKLRNLYNFKLLKIKTELDFSFNNLTELNNNASTLKSILDQNSASYEVTHIELYSRTNSSAYVLISKTNGCFYYYWHTFSFDAVMKWYSGMTPVFREFQFR